MKHLNSQIMAMVIGIAMKIPSTILYANSEKVSDSEWYEILESNSSGENLLSGKHKNSKQILRGKEGGLICLHHRYVLLII